MIDDGVGAGPGSGTMPPGPSGSRLRRASLADVALQAGVSVATASRSLRGVDRVATATRDRVLDAANELNYQQVTRALPEPDRPHSRTVAVIVPFFARWFFSTVTDAALSHLRAHDCDVLLYHLGSADVRDDFLTRIPLSGRVDGILSLSMPLTEQHTLTLRALGLPLVSVGSQVAGCPSVGIDDVATAATAVDHLLNLGHQRIGWISGRADDPRFEFSSSLERRLGYEQALGRAGLEFDPQLVVEGCHGIKGGVAAMEELLGRPGLPTAVVAEFDELAIGALWTLGRAGLRVPHDVSVMGIDDMDMAQYVNLTTVAQDVAAQGRHAAAELLRMMSGEANPEGGARHTLQATRLVLRDSTAPPRSDRRSGAS